MGRKITMILEAIKNFGEQLKYQPEIENAGALKMKNKFVIAGMGGSNLASGLLKIWNPMLDLLIHRDYGLPKAADLNERLVICSSYSGNTEETISVLNQAVDSKLSVAAVSVGGKMLDLARELEIPYVQMPPDHIIQPRLAIGFNLKAILKIMGEEQELSDLEKKADLFKAESFEPYGKELAKKMNGAIPVVYSSVRNKPLAYLWKVTFNEDAKIPAFCNVFPEANHNEMIGFDTANDARQLSEKFRFIFLRDKDDGDKILKRMDLTKKEYEERGLGVEMIEMGGESVWDKILESLTTASWTAYHLAQNYGVEAEKVPLIEEFKAMMG